ncbi:MAG: lipopolysaccharide biosynthesis protein [Draconibacterium sp.]
MKERPGLLPKYKFLADTALNILSATIPVFALQFILLPLVAAKTNATAYGKLVTIIALVNLSAATLGNVLNNSKLINFKKYENLEINGDYNLTLLFFIAVNIFFILGGLLFYGELSNTFGSLLIIVFSVFQLFRGYAIVEFRIKLNFKYILADSFFLLAGYFIGYLFFLSTERWEFIFLLGFACSSVYILYNTTIFKAPLKRTRLFKSTCPHTLVLLLSSILIALGIYIDRLILFPILGGETVSIYFTASILPKTLLLIVNPVTGVLLSYLAQYKSFDNKYFLLLFLGSASVGLIGYFLIVLLSQPLLGLIYPQFVSAAAEYIPLISAGIIIMLVTTVLNAVLLKFRNIQWQFVINAIYLGLYFAFTLTLLRSKGLMGFCIGILVANLAKLILTMAAFYFPLNRDKQLKLNLFKPIS